MEKPYKHNINQQADLLFGFRLWLNIMRMSCLKNLNPQNISFWFINLRQLQRKGSNIYGLIPFGNPLLTQIFISMYDKIHYKKKIKKKFFKKTNIVKKKKKERKKERK